MTKKYSFKEGDQVNNLGTIFIKEIGGEKRICLFRCYCGRLFESRIDGIGRGATKSCGCYNTTRTIETHITHGLASNPLYKVWTQMKDRLYNSNNDCYHNYGGRGIIMFPPWREDFKLWFDYISSLPNFKKEGHTLDRRDNNGNYEPGNMRWATRSFQNRNMRKKKSNTSGYTGVAPFRKKWQAYIGGKHLGHFESVIDAVIARNDYIIKNNLPEYKVQEVIK